MAAGAIELRNVSKSFAGVRVLEGVNLTLERGEIRGLVGQNGSGKSTLIKILSGYHEPDRGSELLVGGEPVPLPIPPGAAHRFGFAFVHQDLGLVPGLTVLENLRVGRYAPELGLRIRWAFEREEARRALRRIGADVPLHLPIGALPPVERALVAIARAFDDLGDRPHGLLVLDEPTAYLPRDAVERLFTAVRRVAESGTTVLFVSHRLDEVRDLTHRVSVLRDGRLVGTVDTEEASEDTLIAMILGRPLATVYPEAHREGQEVAFAVHRLTGEVVQDVSFEVRRGEVLGLTGLVGMGQEEVPYLLVGALPAKAGEMRIGDARLPVPGMSPALARRAGIALLPADRQGASGVGAFTVRENVSLPVLPKLAPRGRVRAREELGLALRLLQDYAVRPPEPERLLATLSGGNQQKALLAKWLQETPRVLLLHEPTQGVDVGARREIFGHLERVAEAGTAIVIVGSDYEELAHVCRRVLVFRDGRVTAGLSGDNLTEEGIVAACYRT